MALKVYEMKLFPWLGSYVCDCNFWPITEQSQCGFFFFKKKTFYVYIIRVLTLCYIQKSNYIDFNTTWFTSDIKEYRLTFKNYIYYQSESNFSSNLISSLSHPNPVLYSCFEIFGLLLSISLFHLLFCELPLICCLGFNSHRVLIWSWSCQDIYAF